MRSIIKDKIEDAREASDRRKREGDQRKREEDLDPEVQKKRAFYRAVYKKRCDCKRELAKQAKSKG